MASNQFVAIVIATIMLPTVAIATQHIVGDDKGWNVNVNYTEWATGKVFHVGDTLVFHYQSPHNVIKVNATGFKDCIADGETLTAGNDSINLKAPGKNWSICLGAIPASAPSDNSARGLSSSWYEILIASMVAVSMIVV